MSSSLLSQSLADAPPQFGRLILVSVDHTSSFGQPGIGIGWRKGRRERRREERGGEEEEVEEEEEEEERYRKNEGEGIRRRLSNVVLIEHIVIGGLFVVLDCLEMKLTHEFLVLDFKILKRGREQRGGGRRRGRGRRKGGGGGEEEE